AAAVTVGLDLALVRRFGLTGVAAATLTGFALSATVLYAWSQRLYPLPFRGVRAAVLFAVAIAVWVAGRAAGDAFARGAGGAFPGMASLGSRALLWLAYAAFAARLARPVAERPRVAAVPVAVA